MHIAQRSAVLRRFIIFRAGLDPGKPLQLLRPESGLQVGLKRRGVPRGKLAPVNAKCEIHVSAPFFLQIIQKAFPIAAADGVA